MKIEIELNETDSRIFAELLGNRNRVSATMGYEKPVTADAMATSMFVEFLKGEADFWEQQARFRGLLDRPNG